MEFGDLGKHCHHPSCHQRDFLPFTCKHCDDTFCLEHRTPLSHDCNKYVDPSNNPTDAPPVIVVKRSPKCEFDHCKRRDLTPVTCRHCKHSFCIQHRFPHSHQCQQTMQTNNKTALAKPLSLFKSGVIVPPSSAAIAGSHAAEMQIGHNTNVASRSRLIKPQA